MARTSAIFSISLPPEMASELDRVRRKEHRTRSELVREALRHYIRNADARTVQAWAAALPEEQPTAEEIEAIAQATEEFREGKFITYNQLRHELGHRRQQPRAKKPQARSRR
jgi:metal-responsive CopG/Arc/MetJ family transcriptional regulator